MVLEVEVFTRRCSFIFLFKVLTKKTKNKNKKASMIKIWSQIKWEKKRR
jgi:hypothetical protein